MIDEVVLFSTSSFRARLLIIDPDCDGELLQNSLYCTVCAYRALFGSISSGSYQYDDGGLSEGTRKEIHSVPEASLTLSCVFRERVGLECRLDSI